MGHENSFSQGIVIDMVQELRRDMTASGQYSAAQVNSACRDEEALRESQGLSRYSVYLGHNRFDGQYIAASGHGVRQAAITLDDARKTDVREGGYVSGAIERSGAGVHLSDFVTKAGCLRQVVPDNNHVKVFQQLTKA